jgi:hypothetical protein
MVVLEKKQDERTPAEQGKASSSCRDTGFRPASGGATAIF